MTAETIHTCSYECDRPGCIRAQRDELAARLEALTAAQQQDGGGCSHEAWEENGGWCECVDCGHGWSARTPPPSAPVGVEAIAAEIRASLGRGATVSTRRRWAVELEALAQQPAAVDEGFVSRLAEALTDQDWDVDPDGDGSGIAQLRAAVVAAQRQEPKS